MEIAALQKGLVLLVNGLEVVEEGAGFGVPIAKYSDATYFSRTATVYVEEQNQIFKEIKKVFLLDSVSKKQVHGASVNDSLYSVLHAAFEKAYIHRRKMRSVFDWIMRLRKTIGVETHFADAPPHGQVTVTFHCYPDQIRVSADFSKLDAANCREILLLNEQGATFFRRFRSGNKVSEGTEIGAWTKVDAARGEYSDTRERILFSVEKKDGATLYCGWEQVKDRFSWAGMTFSLNPKTSTFNYAIQLRENNT
jgi:hypothetical protein